MEDYTKFRLKDKDELLSLLKDKDNLFVISCNKCFKEFTGEDEPECGEFAHFAALEGKAVTGCVKADFLCNKTLTARRLEAMPSAQTENIIAIACGLGVQTVAELAALPVYAACDSIGVYGSHGMALTKRLCEACGQCYLNLTGGVCPIVDCSKSLLNGQCGGSANGKCEIDAGKDCAWEKIHERLGTGGRTGGIPPQQVQLRDYSKINYKLISDYVRSVREKRFDGYYGGVHLAGDKHLSEHLPITQLPAPRTVVIPLSQHIGAPAAPLVSAGDLVMAGQKIGEASGFVSSAIHASISGRVIAVEPRRHPTSGLDVLSVAIESDGNDTLHESVKPQGSLDSLSPDDIVSLIREKGIVGMGGAAFPTAVKLKSSKPIDTVLLNGCECEPLLTADHRVMLEYADDVIFGLQALLKTTGAKKGVIAIEDDKRDAVGLLESKTAEIADITVVAARTKYPQGAEKMLIKRALGRRVPSGGLPLDVGVVVCNVSTAKAVSDAIQKGLPLIERVVAVTGEKINNPGNYTVRIGASVKEIIDLCGGLNDDNTIVKLGGPMMGVPIDDLNVPIVKGVNGIIAVEATVSEPSPCIRCGRCVDVCPMELLPLYFPLYVKNENWAGAKEKAANDCIECNCCNQICPSKIKIRQAITQAKAAIKAVGL